MTSARRFARSVKVRDPGTFSPAAVAFVERVVRPVTRLLFRPTMHGLENLPRDRPYLLVANHSAGVGLAELASFASMWISHVGPDRRIAGFALPLGFVVWPLSVMHRHAGTVPSTYEAARDALAKGVPLLVFPGGDHESLKPVWQVHRVDFSGRVGFLRIAREAGIPIIPLGIRNGAWTAPILVRGKWLASLLVAPRILGVKRWGISLLGAVGAIAMALCLPWAWPWRILVIGLWLGSPLTFCPIIPATLHFRIGSPLKAEDLFSSEHDCDDDLAMALARVERAVEAMVRR